MTEDFARQEKWDKCPLCSKRQKSYLFMRFNSAAVEESWTFYCGAQLTESSGSDPFFDLNGDHTEEEVNKWDGAA